MKVTVEEIQKLAERAEAAGQHDLSGILYTAIGAVNLDKTEEMMETLVPFITKVMDGVLDKFNKRKI